MSGMQAWRYLEAALALGKELKVWSLQNDALLCEYSFHQTGPYLISLHPLTLSACMIASMYALCSSKADLRTQDDEAFAFTHEMCSDAAKSSEASGMSAWH